MSFEEWDEAQYFLDGLTIKHVHLETGTPAFYIQHCHGTWIFFVSAALLDNCLPVQKNLRPNQKNECAIGVIPTETMEKTHRYKNHNFLKNLVSRRGNLLD